MVAFQTFCPRVTTASAILDRSTSGTFASFARNSVAAW
jgi:hypothetical protein